MTDNAILDKVKTCGRKKWVALLFWILRTLAVFTVSFAGNHPNVIPPQFWAVTLGLYLAFEIIFFCTFYSGVSYTQKLMNELQQTRLVISLSRIKFSIMVYLVSFALMVTLTFIGFSIGDPLGKIIAILWGLVIILDLILYVYWLWQFIRFFLIEKKIKNTVKYSSSVNWNNIKL